MEYDDGECMACCCEEGKNYQCNSHYTCLSCISKWLTQDMKERKDITVTPRIISVLKTKLESFHAYSKCYSCKKEIFCVLVSICEDHKSSFCDSIDVSSDNDNSDSMID